MITVYVDNTAPRLTRSRSLRPTSPAPAADHAGVYIGGPHVEMMADGDGCRHDRSRAVHVQAGRCSISTRPMLLFRDDQAPYAYDWITGFTSDSRPAGTT